MHGLVSLLPDPYYARVKQIWQELETRFGLKGIQVTPTPHFSWQIYADYPTPLLEQTAQKVAARTKPFQITTTGLGLFTGSHPVIYIPVVKTAALSAVHQQIWHDLGYEQKGTSPLYSPGCWMPHISLAYEDVTSVNIGPVMQWLAFQDFTWEMTIDNLSYICQRDGDLHALQCTYAFYGE